MRRTVTLIAALLPMLWVVSATPATATVVSIRTETHTVSSAVVRSAVLALPATSSRVATYWRGQADAHVTVAFSLDGVSFAPAVDAGRDEVGEQRHNGITYGAVRVATARLVRVTTDRPLAQVWIDGMADGARTVTMVHQPSSASAAMSQPNVSPRSAWGADESLRYNADGTLKQAPTYYATSKLIVHHTDTTNADPDPAATIRAIYRYHVVTQGWADIGYNFLVDESGRTWEGRWSRVYPAGSVPSGDDDQGRGVTGSHTGGWNSGTVGIALLATLTDRDATPSARGAVVDLLAWESERNRVDPQATTTFTNPVSGAVITTPNIAGHRDYTSTECPGGAFYATLPQLRAEVAARITGTPTVADTAAPTTPTGVLAIGGSRQVALSWTASSDNVGVTGYLVQRSTTGKPGSYAQVATPTATQWTNSGLRSGRTYWYVISARDGAGNVSAASAAASAKAL